MTGFRMEITFTQSRWDAMTPAEHERIQKMVDETFDPTPRNRSDVQFDHDYAAAEGWGLQTEQVQAARSNKI